MMRFRTLNLVFIFVLLATSFSSCLVTQQSAKNGFNDGIYHIRKFSNEKVYVLRIDEDTIATFPVQMYGDSTAILTKNRINYTATQRKFKDNQVAHSFYRPSFDVDVMTIAMKYRPSVYDFPNQLTTNFNGALFGGYRIDAYKLNYKRTPLNTYKQSVKHTGYSIGLYAGIGNALVDPFTLNSPNSYLQYDGMIVITGIAVNFAVSNLNFGISVGTDHLADKYHNSWIYEGKPYLGFNLGLNLN